MPTVGRAWPSYVSGYVTVITTRCVKCGSVLHHIRADENNLLVYGGVPNIADLDDIEWYLKEGVTA